MASNDIRPASADPDSDGADLRAAQLALIARRSGIACLSTALNAGLVYLLLRDRVTTPWLEVWAAVQIAGALWFYGKARRRRRPPRGSIRGIRKLVVSSALAGFSLGTIVYFVGPATDVQSFIVFITLGAMASAASTTLATVPSAARAYIAGALVQPAMYWMLRGELDYVVLAGLAASMTFFLVRNAGVTHAAFLESFERQARLERTKLAFQAELSEWLDLSRTTEAFALLDEHGAVLLYNSPFEQLMRPAAVRRGDLYADLLRHCAQPPRRIDGVDVDRDDWVASRLQISDTPRDTLEEYAGDTFLQVHARRLSSGRQTVWATDVTALHRAERSLHERDQALAAERRLRTVATLAGGVAHDFNNLLTAIYGAASLLHASTSEGETTRLSEDILDCVARGSSMTRQLLSYGNLPVVNLQPCQLDEVLRPQLPLLQRSLPATIDATFEAEPDLWLARTDPELVTQVLVNLVLNAKDAMRGGGRIAVSLSNHRPTGTVQLVVEDTGAGMSPAVRRRIFEPFFSTKAPAEGSGLGLSSVQNIVRKSGGNIDVQSVPGRGTRFIVRLPRTMSRGPQTPPEVPIISSEQRTIVMVDDEPMVLRLGARCLRKRGHHVLEATDADAALALLTDRNHHVDLLLTDVVMPACSGVELAARAHRLRPELPVLFMSGFDAGILDDHREGCFLRKPFSVQELADAVSTCIVRHTKLAG